MCLSGHYLTPTVPSRRKNLLYSGSKWTLFQGLRRRNIYLWDFFWEGNVLGYEGRTTMSSPTLPSPVTRILAQLLALSKDREAGPGEKKWIYWQFGSELSREKCSDYLCYVCTIVTGHRKVQHKARKLYMWLQLRDKVLGNVWVDSSVTGRYWCLEGTPWDLQVLVLWSNESDWNELIVTQFIIRKYFQASKWASGLGRLAQQHWLMGNELNHLWVTYIFHHALFLICSP